MLEFKNMKESFANNEKDSFLVASLINDDLGTNYISVEEFLLDERYTVDDLSNESLIATVKKFVK